MRLDDRCGSCVDGTHGSRDFLAFCLRSGASHVSGLFAIRSPLGVSGRFAVRDGHRLAIDVAESFKSAKEWIDSRPILRRKEQHSDPPHACWLLRACR